MAGVTDTLFRRVIRGLGRLRAADDGVHQLGRHHAERRKNAAVSLFSGRRAPDYRAAFLARILPSWRKPPGWWRTWAMDAVDINLGCPAKKVVKCGGSGLLRDLPLLEQIFSRGARCR